MKCMESSRKPPEGRIRGNCGGLSYLNAPGVMRRRFGGNKLSYCGKGLRGRITKIMERDQTLYEPFVLV